MVSWTHHISIFSRHNYSYTGGGEANKRRVHNVIIIESVISLKWISSTTHEYTSLQSNHIQDRPTNQQPLKAIVSTWKVAKKKILLDLIKRSE